jgi:hypothetical protein
LSAGSSVITQRPWPLALTSDANARSSPIVLASPANLAVARIDRSELHWTTSIWTGPSPKICMISVP